MQNVDRFKVFAALIIWSLGFLGGMLPITIHDIDPKARSILNMLAAGIFLAGSICHLLPDAISNERLSSLTCPMTKKIYENGRTDDKYSVCSTDLAPFFFFGVGFLLILILESFAHALQKRLSRNKRHNAPPGELSPLILNNTMINTPPKSNKYADLECSGSTVAHAHVDGMIGDSEYQMISIVVFISLSFHSLMEGVAIGSNDGYAWGVFLAVIAHKSLAAFALGLELISHRVEKERFLLGIFIFSCMSPMGILLGRWTLVDADSPTLTSGICTALSGGTFLYVATMEIIPQEMQNRRDQLAKNLALCFGYCAFGVLAHWT